MRVVERSQIEKEGGERGECKVTVSSGEKKKKKNMTY